MSKKYSENAIPGPLFNMGAPLPNLRLSYDLLYKELMAEFPSETGENIRGKFEGPNGIRTKLESKLNFNTRAFRDQKFEELKLLKLLFSYQERAKQNGQGTVNLINILAKPTIENVDPNSLFHGSLNGDHFQNIKRELEKEVDPAFIKLTKETIYTLCLGYHDVINEIMYHMVASNGDIDSLNHINKSLSSLKMPVKISSTYNHTLFETFYLKLLEHENIAREVDLLSMNTLINPGEETSHDFLKEMKSAVTWLMSMDEVEDFIKKHSLYISQLVLMKSDVSSKEVKKIVSFTPHISRLLNWYRLHSFSDFSSGVPLLVVVSCLQIIFYIHDKKTTYIYRPYGYATERTTLSSKLKMGDDCPVFFQMLFISLIKRRGLINLGYRDQITLLDSIEKTIDKLLLQALTFHNIEDLVQSDIQNLIKK